MTNEVHDAIVRAYEDALEVRSACNPSGIAHSLSNLFSVIQSDIAHAASNPKMHGFIGTDGKSWHPVFVLFASKFHDLAGLGMSDNDRYGLAHRFAEAVKARGLMPGSDAYNEALGNYYLAYEISF